MRAKYKSEAKGKFQQLVDELPGLFSALDEATLFIEKGVKDQEGRAGIYVFYERGRAVHVGRTGNLGARLRAHTVDSHNSASFAFKQAREKTGNKKATYKPEGSRAALMKDPKFHEEFNRQRERIKRMKVGFLELDDPVKQYLLELYAHIAYGLRLDEFDTS